ncbi:MAG: TolB family protein [Planctomycetota bacterium]
MRNILLIMVLSAALTPMCLGESKCNSGKSPLDDPPPYIRQVTQFGQRADFSHDGKRLLFIEKTFGDVYEVELTTGIIRPMTHRYYHEGYTRALYLANGDILLSGAREFDAENPTASRREENAELWVLKKDLSGPPLALGEHCSEGPAVSRTKMRIAWTQKQKILMADIVYGNNVPKLVNKKTVMDARELPFECWPETQNFRPPDEKEIIFSAYGYQGSEVMGLNIETGEVVNYSNAPQQYDEPEGIFPDGKYTLTECNAHNVLDVEYGEFSGIYLDIYKLALDGSGKSQRITNFNDYPGYKATNPVVSDDGRYMAFQYAKKGDKAGVGRGLLLFDLEMYEKTKCPASR